MGKASRERPKRLPHKLRQIRNAFEMSQGQLLVALGIAGKSYRNYISAYELGKNEPPLPILLKYARVAGVCTDVLIDDDQELPDDLPGAPDHHVSRVVQAHRKRKHRRPHRG